MEPTAVEEDTRLRCKNSIIIPFLKTFIKKVNSMVYISTDENVSFTKIVHPCDDVLNVIPYS